MMLCPKCGRWMHYICKNSLGSDCYDCECGFEFTDWSNIFPELKTQSNSKVGVK